MDDFVRVTLLGPLEVGCRHERVPLPRGRARSILALLLLRAGETVKTERIIETVWGERAPETVRNSLRTQVWRARLALRGQDAVRLEGHENGYRAVVPPWTRDVDVFDARVREGQRRIRSGDSAGAAQAFRTAIALWKGDPLEGVEFYGREPGELLALRERRQLAWSAWIDAEIAAGRPEETIPAIRSHLGEHRYDERAYGQLMTALYRSGHRAEALDVFASARRTLTTDLGLDPSEELRDLQQAILAGRSCRRVITYDVPEYLVV